MNQKFIIILKLILLIDSIIALDAPRFSNEIVHTTSYNLWHQKALSKFRLSIQYISCQMLKYRLLIKKSYSAIVITIQRATAFVHLICSKLKYASCTLAFLYRYYN